MTQSSIPSLVLLFWVAATPGRVETASPARMAAVSNLRIVWASLNALHRRQTQKRFKPLRRARSRLADPAGGPLKAIALVARRYHRLPVRSWRIAVMADFTS